MSEKVINLPPFITNNLDEKYRNMIADFEKEIVKNGAKKFFKSHGEKVDAADEWLLDIPHHARKRWAGFIPLPMEIMANEVKAVELIYYSLALPDVRVQHLVHDLLDVSGGFREVLQQANGNPTGTNLGLFDSVFFPHVFWAKGSRNYIVDDDLASKLRVSSLIENAPAGFLDMPYSTIFIESQPGFTIDNQVSGDHEVDGMYVNKYTIASKDIKRDWDKRLDDDYSQSLMADLVDKGIVTKDGGDIKCFEVMVTGKPKETLFNDATFSFVINIQDENMPLNKVLQAHIDHYSKQPGGIKKHGIKFEGMREKGHVQMVNCIEFVTKFLLHLTSGEAEKETILEYDDLLRQKARTSMNAQKRKLDRKLKYAYNYTIVR